MADYKPLGQSNPAATTWTAVYTCGVSGGAIGSVLRAVNTSTTTPAKVRVAHRALGATLAASHYLAYDVTLYPAGTGDNANEATWEKLGIQNTDVIAVYADTANVAFTLEGVQSP